MNPLEKAIDALERISRFEYAYGAENAIHDAQEALQALRSMQEVDVDSECKLALTYIHGVAINTDDELLAEAAEKLEYHLIPKE